MDDLKEQEALAEAAAEAADASYANEQHEQAVAASLQQPQQQDHPVQQQPPPVNPPQQRPTEVDPSAVCVICGKGSSDETSSSPAGAGGRIMIRFFPALPSQMAVAAMEEDEEDASASVTTWNEDISMHIFCGKTANILPTVQKPQYEILSKAGIKNKHGIGQDVNAALARSRFATNTKVNPGSKEKVFYLVQEFEAHLHTIRLHFAQQQQAAAAVQAAAAQQQSLYQSLQQQQQSSSTSGSMEYAPPTFHPYQPATTTTTSTKVPPHKAATTYMKPSRQQQQSQQQSQQHSWNTSTTTMPTIDYGIAPQGYIIPSSQQQQHHQTTMTTGTSTEEGMMTADGKIQCGCGGTHLPTHTPKGATSWRNHVMTKRHQKWMEENGLLGAV